MSSRRQDPDQRHGSLPPAFRAIAPPDLEQEPQPLEQPVFRIPGLTPIQARFAHEYANDPTSATAAYMRASPNCTKETASVNASVALSNTKVASFVQSLLEDKQKRLHITTDKVLTRLWAIGTADHRELTELWIGSCRCCWGLYNQFQFTDAEYQHAEDLHIRAEAERQARAMVRGKEFEPTPFASKGGPGYQQNKEPNPDCGECAGRGKAIPVLKDTRHLSEAASLLYAGIKVTKEGVEYRTLDQLAALRLVGLHLGMWNDKLNLTPTEEDANPLATLLRQIGASMGAALPVVADDPELGQHKHAGDVTDVEAKPKPPKPPPKDHWKRVT